MKKDKIVLGDKEIKNLVGAIASGEQTIDICKRLGICKATLHRIMKRQGIQNPRFHRPRYQWAPEQEELLIRLYNAGYRYEDMCHKLNVAYKDIHIKLQKLTDSGAIKRRNKKRKYAVEADADVGKFIVDTCSKHDMAVIDVCKAFRYVARRLLMQEGVRVDSVIKF